MKIIGIGTDLVAIKRIQAIWVRYGNHFSKRILTPNEQKLLEQNKNPVSFLAKRYAAKEALAKALGIGFQPQGILLNEIGVRNDELGRPHLQFHGKTAKVIEDFGVTESQITLTDEKEYALAFVVLIG